MNSKEMAHEMAVRDVLISNPALFIANYSGWSIQEFQEESLEFITHNQRCVLLLPATHGKSSLIAKWYVIYRICHNPNIRIIVVMKNDDEASLYAQGIRRELTMNYPLIRDWGPFKPKGRDTMWNNDAIFVAKRQINDVRPTVEFVGSKSIDQVLGHRCDILICDDIVTLETVNTREQSDKQIKAFNMGAQTCPRFLWDTDPDTKMPIVPDGIYFPLDLAYRQVILTGTVFKPYDLFHKKAGRISKLKPGKVYIGKDPSFKVLYWDCWKDKDNRIPLWPEQWSADALEAEEESMGRIDFNCRFRNIAIDEGMTVFKKHWIYGEELNNIEYPGCLDYTRAIGPLNLEDPYLVLGFDPSSSRTSKDSSFCAFVLLAVDRREEPMRRYILDVWRGQLGFEDIFSKLYDGDAYRGIEGFHSMYGYDEARIEANALQKWLLEADKTKIMIAKGLRVRPHETQANKHDPVMGVASLQDLFKNGLIRIPYSSDPTTRERINDFLEQIEEFPEGTHDYAMALWFAEIGIRERDSQFKAWGGGSAGFQVVNPFYDR
jgi:hypothetical protein